MDNKTIKELAVELTVFMRLPKILKGNRLDNRMTLESIVCLTNDKFYN